MGLIPAILLFAGIGIAVVSALSYRRENPDRRRDAIRGIAFGGAIAAVGFVLVS